MKNLSIATIVLIFVFVGMSKINAQESEKSNQNFIWTGEWDTKWNGGTALLILEELDNSVIGTYTHLDGKIEGQAKKDNGVFTLEGIWTQTSGEGWFKFTMNNDYKSFTGEWGNKGSKTVLSEWNGTKHTEVFIDYKKTEMIDLPYSEEKTGITYKESHEKWKELKEKNGNSYIYQRTFGSWAGFGHTTQIKVENGIVTERIYESFEFKNGKKQVKSTYTETKKKIGTHNEGHSAITIDQLYKDGKQYLEVDEKQNKIYFTTFENGLLKFCGHYPIGCVDDCFEGVSISGIKWIK